MLYDNKPTTTMTRVVVIIIVIAIAKKFFEIISVYVIIPTKIGIKNKIIFFNIKLQKLSIQTSLIIPIFNKLKRIINPKIGTGKAICAKFKINLDKYKIKNIIPKPIIKLIIFFIAKIIIL